MLATILQRYGEVLSPFGKPTHWLATESYYGGHTGWQPPWAWEYWSMWHGCLYSFENATRGMQVSPSSEHFAFLAECFLSSAATTATNPAT